MPLGKDRNKNHDIGAVVLAAGKSERMGRPKLVLPWKDHTVIWQVVESLSQAEINDIVVVTGASRDLVEEALTGSIVQCTYNPDYERSEMLRSLQVGISALPAHCKALLVVLGDQPLIESAVIKRVMDTYRQAGSSLVIPSYQLRRGHPWLVGKAYWNELLGLPENRTMHDFITAHQDEIVYVNVDTPSILKDMDTFEDYQQTHP